MSGLYGIEFSQFVDGGDLADGDIVVGLRSGLNTKFNFDATPGTGTAIVNVITQNSHGFIVENVVYFNGTVWALAKADNSADAEVIGIVSVVEDADTFSVLSCGFIDVLSALTPGGVYFLSETVAGQLTLVEPTTAGAISKPLLIATSNTAGFFFNFRGKIISTFNSNNLTYVTNTNETAFLPNSQPLSLLATGIAKVTTGTGIVSTLAIPLIVADGGTGATSFTAYSVLCGGTSSTNPLQSVASVGTAGQVLTSNGPAALPTFQSIVGAGWTDQITTPATLAPGMGYSANTAGLLTFNMPATVAFGAEFEIRGEGAGGWLVQFNTGQTGHLSSASTTVAGSFASTNRYDCISILCTVANTTFVCTATGSITPA